jgi:hypothetical protein
MKMPAKRLERVSWAARPMTMPVMPAPATQAVMSMSQASNRK